MNLSDERNRPTTSGRPYSSPAGLEIPDNRTKQAQIAVDLPLDDRRRGVTPRKGNHHPLPPGVPLVGEKPDAGGYLPGLTFMAELVIDYTRFPFDRRFPEFDFYFYHTFSFLVVHILGSGTFFRRRETSGVISIRRIVRQN